jgi:hypothetical protein
MGPAVAHPFGEIRGEACTRDSFRRQIGSAIGVRACSCLESLAVSAAACSASRHCIWRGLPNGPTDYGGIVSNRERELSISG